MTFTPALRLPRPHHAGQLKVRSERWLERLRDLGEGGGWPPDELLAALFGNSPYLSEIALSDPRFLADLWRDGADAAVGREMARLAALPAEPEPLAVALRRAKRHIALGVAVADMAGAWPLARVTRALSEFADLAIDRLLDAILLDMERGGQLALGGEPGAAGITVLGMGKLGAFELNYSSDIDLIVLYDREAPAIAHDDAIGAKLVRATRRLVQLLSERTADGYIFRTDLRLRPDPGSTPLAISVQAAETYYESVGQNWERAAMIKARPVAGDPAIGAAFLDSLRPYIWRKHLDFAAINDIHSIKRQIDAYRGTGAIKVLGHNVKLGRGGIREIEFFAQTQQLIFGGRHPTLRLRGTIEALEALSDAGMITRDVVVDLTRAYDFLRRLEHRLQMIDDQQTHSLPETEDAVDAVATFMGYDDAAAFRADFLDTLRLVEGHYAKLFEEAPSLAGPGGNLVFTGTDRDPDTLKTLEGLGYREAERAWDIAARWHHGRYRSTHTVRARELLTELMPAILKALGDSADPDQALLRFDALLAGMPAGIQIFSLFKVNPPLLELVATIMGSAPRIATHLGRRPILLDGVLTRDYFGALPDRASLSADLSRALDLAEDEQDILDISRRWANDQRFRVGVQQLAGTLSPELAGAAYSDIAEAVLGELPARIERIFADQHGQIAGAAFAIVALGRLGSREMTASSDLDLIFIYEAPEGSEQSDGERPLTPGHYYARLMQRVVSALSAPTNEGTLYEVDMRLRPSGNKGPLATSLGAFETYQRDSAWTWEHLALARARVVSGPPLLAARIDAAIAAALSRPRGRESLLRDVQEMRARLVEHRPSKSLWDFKLLRGGFFDIEFAARYLMLLHAHAKPFLLARHVVDTLVLLRDARILAPDAAAALIEAHRLWSSLQGLMRLALEEQDEAFDEAKAPEGLRRLLAKAGGVDRFELLREKVRATADAAHAVYAEIIEKPAAALPPREEEKT
ncbi:MAG: bifunctional [glutamine synthetase] adenylyltransferase/[glutamine synthetase]-adenylyl-L-tyrosine phosphorylase [Alphaproteobacteria bacterium]|nr:bifunctional [glutamine synthetase] adenylyltransferase/[glutamine synthetase]-adenylyl-L-tyrosine phosphorylase [Alphaproteobacteria bacterium]